MFHHVLFYPTVSIDPQKNELDVKKKRCFTRKFIMEIPWGISKKILRPQGLVSSRVTV